MLQVITSLAVFAVVIASGWALVRLGGVPAGSDTILTRVCFYAATPALLVLTIARADLATVISRQTAAGLAAEVLGVAGAWVVHRWVLGRTLGQATIGGLAGGYVNAANLGIPVLIVLLGDATAIAPILLLQLLVLSPVAFALLDWEAARAAGRAQAGQGAAGARSGGRPWRLWLSPLRNPLLLGVLTGLVLNVAGWDVEHWLGGLVVASLEELGKLAVTVMMISLGMSLAAGSPKVTRRLTVTSVTRLTSGQATQVVEPPAPGHDEPERGAVLWFTVSWKLVVVPLIAVGVGLALGLRGPALLVPVTTAALPCAQNVFMYATRYSVSKALARDCVLLTTAAFVPVELLAAVVLG